MYAPSTPIPVKPPAAPQVSQTPPERVAHRMPGAADRPVRLARVGFEGWSDGPSGDGAVVPTPTVPERCPDGRAPDMADRCPTWLDELMRESQRHPNADPRRPAPQPGYPDFFNAPRDGGTWRGAAAAGTVTTVAWEPGPSPLDSIPNPLPPADAPRIEPLQPSGPNTMEFEIPGHDAPHTHDHHSAEPREVAPRMTD